MCDALWMASDRSIDEALADLGIVTAEGIARTRLHLESVGLTNPRKTRVSVEKIPRIEASVREAFALVCERCAEDTRADREVIVVRSPSCARCGGSDTRRAALRLGAVAPGLRLVVVGGSAGTRAELERVLGGALALRLVAGTTGRTREQAAADHAWADVVVIWASTELPHKVSQLYTGIADPSRKRITVARRGAAAVIDAILTWRERRG